MSKQNSLGIGVIGAGRIGTLRARLAGKHPCVNYLAISDKDPARADALMKTADWTGTAVLRLGVRFASRMSPYNLIVTNVPGIPVPRYVAGAEITAGYPIAPTAPHTPVSIALYGYRDSLFIGLDADGTAMTDLEIGRAHV